MLGTSNAVANIAVKDLAAAERFYTETLGLTRVGGQDEELIVLRNGNTTLNVYRSRYAGTNQATAVTWAVGEEMEEIVRALKARGVMFEQYDMPEMTREGDIHVAGNVKIAWFKDPESNILNLVSG